jgi:crossover junction endodeoxyribonuclease RusA
MNTELELAHSFPIEFFIVDQIPVSLQGSPESKARWKSSVEFSARMVINLDSWATLEPVAVTIFYFPDGPMVGDLDNIVKVILDAMRPFIYVQDSQVERLLVQKFEPDRPPFVADNPSTTLAFVLIESALNSFRELAWHWQSLWAPDCPQFFHEPLEGRAAGVAP